MARRRRRSAKRKKKPDQTTLIVILSGAAFLLGILLLFGLSSNKANKKGKRRDNLERSKIADNTPLPQSTSKAKSKEKPKAEPKRNSPIIPEITNKRQRDVPPTLNISSIHDLPDYFDLPEVNRKSKKLTATPFADNSSLTVDLVGGEEIGLLQSIAKSQSEKTDKNQAGVWLLKNNSNSRTLAEIRFNNNGILFTWNEDIHPDDVHLIHNSRLHIRLKNETKNVQLREPVPMPAVRLADKKSLVEYQVEIKHPPENPLDEILWSMAPSVPNSEPFNHENIGQCTTHGLKKLSKIIEWSPKNKSIGLIHFRYRFSWNAVPTDREDTINLILKVKKHYKINPTVKKSKWRELTRDNFESEFLKTRDSYESSLGEFIDLYEKLEKAFIRFNIEFDNPNYIRLSEEDILHPFVDPIAASRGRIAIKAEMDSIRKNVREQIKAKVVAKWATKLYNEFERFLEQQRQLLEIRELSGKPLVMLGTFHDSLSTSSLDIKLKLPTKLNDETILLASYPTLPTTRLTSAPTPRQTISEQVEKPWGIPPGMNPFKGRFEHLNSKNRK